MDKNKLAAIVAASAFTLIDPDVCYTGVHAQGEILCAKTVF